MSDFQFDEAVRPRPHSDVIVQRLDNAAILVDIAANRIFELNETATRVWELVGKGVNTSGIVRQLVEEFDVEEQQAADEVKNLFNQLRREGLLIF